LKLIIFHFKKTNIKTSIMKIFIEEQKFTQSWLFIGLAIAFVVVAMPIIKDWDTISQGSFGEILNDAGGILVISFVFVFFNFYAVFNVVQNRRVVSGSRR
jgi:hypothetical protein